MAVMGLGHVGYFVKDIEVMKDFWGNFMGMTLTKSTEGAGFYSADPESVDHEIAIMQGRPEADDSHLIQQISLRVESLDNIRDFKRRAIERGEGMMELQRENTRLKERQPLVGSYVTGAF